jgi:predicted NBD/HSP70 family sugar kinase
MAYQKLEALLEEALDIALGVDNDAQAVVAEQIRGVTQTGRANATHVDIRRGCQRHVCLDGQCIWRLGELAIECVHACLPWDGLTGRHREPPAACGSIMS